MPGVRSNCCGSTKRSTSLSVCAPRCIAPVQATEATAENGGEATAAARASDDGPVGTDADAGSTARARRGGRARTGGSADFTSDGGNARAAVAVGGDADAAAQAEVTDEYFGTVFNEADAAAESGDGEDADATAASERAFTRNPNAEMIDATADAGASGGTTARGAAVTQGDVFFGAVDADAEV